MGFCVVYNLKRELIMDGGLIAHFYVRHDTFLTDFIAACPAIPEVGCLLLSSKSKMQKPMSLKSSLVLLGSFFLCKGKDNNIPAGVCSLTVASSTYSCSKGC